MPASYFGSSVSGRGASATKASAPLAFLIAVVLLATPALVHAQAPPLEEDQVEGEYTEEEVAEAEPGVPVSLRNEAPRTYIDCRRRCDGAHWRQHIDFVNHVRDPDLAEVYVLITDQPTGGGGRVFTLAFIGSDAFEGLDATLTYTSGQTDTRTEERDGLTQMLMLGLVPYVAQTPLAPHLGLSFNMPEGVTVQPQADPWQNWTFEIYGGGNLNDESTQGQWNARYGFYANRVTEDWKIRLRPYFNHNSRTIRRDDSEDIRVNQRRHGFESYLIRSLGPHFGAGIFAEYTTTTIDNLNHGITITPAVEYSLYPYDESSRRQITFTYRIGYEVADYIEETIYEQTEETLLNHSLNASVQLRQPWGSISSGLTGSRYFHDAQNHRLTFNGNIQYRLGRGVSLNVGGSYQRINDQLSLPRGEASLEDILLQRRRLATSYRSTANIGLSYTFGSIFTNVVNPRL